mgnify:CR=1 FL=1
MKNLKLRTSVKSSRTLAPSRASKPDDTAILPKPPTQKVRSEAGGKDRHDANAHRNKSNSSNQFGADGEDRYGGGVRSSPPPIGPETTKDK